LSKKVVIRPKRIKIFENFSRIEKDLFNEAKEIKIREMKKVIDMEEFNKVILFIINKNKFRINPLPKQCL
jgi:hypothetical protein